MWSNLSLPVSTWRTLCGSERLFLVPAASAGALPVTGSWCARPSNARAGLPQPSWCHVAAPQVLCAFRPGVAGAAEGGMGTRLAPEGQASADLPAAHSFSLSSRAGLRGGPPQREGLGPEPGGPGRTLCAPGCGPDPGPGGQGAWGVSSALAAPSARRWGVRWGPTGRETGGHRG